MSKTKPVMGPAGEVLWAWDNAHDVVVALMVELCTDLAFGEEQVRHWRVCASVGDVGLVLQPGSPKERELLLVLLGRVRTAVIERGDLDRAGLVGWSVLDGIDVSDGHLRTERLEVACLLDVVGAFTAVVQGDLADPPEGGRWLVGAPGGRDTVPSRRSRMSAEDLARARAEPFHFVIREALRMTGRGTVAIGFVTAGVVHAGDELEFVHGNTTKVVTCRGVEMPNRQPFRDPPDLGLVVADLAPTDIAAGDVLRSRPAVPGGHAQR